MRKESVRNYTIASTWQSDNHKVLWVHCASVGEFEQGRPVLESFRTRHPTWKIVVTFYSPSGYMQFKNWDGADLILALPLDYRAPCAEFIDRVKPDHILWVRYDFWPQIYKVIAEQRIPLTLIGGRIHKDHRLLSSHSVAKTMRQAITKFFTVDESSVSLLHAVGMSNAEYAGDTRFDRVTSIAADPIDNIMDALRSGEEKILVAGSTWHKDQEILALSMVSLIEKGWKVVVVPHEVNEVSINTCSRQFPKARLWSEVGWSFLDTSLLIVDTVGYLSRIYSVADIAYVGGGFESSGVHNILEPMVYDLPVISGPNISRSMEALRANKKGFLRTLDQRDGFLPILESLTITIKEGEIKSWVMGQTGANDRITDYLDNHLSIQERLQ